MTLPLTIAYAHGASGVPNDKVQRLFRENLKHPDGSLNAFLWHPVRWRKCLPGPDANRLRALGDRFAEPDEPCPPVAPLPARNAFDSVVAGVKAGVDIAIDTAGDFATGPLGRVVGIGVDAAGRAGRRLAFNRGRETVGTTIADILNYLADREMQRACVVRTITRILDQAEGKVVFVGESLGGILLVDALAALNASDNVEDDRRLDKAGLLVTIASQSAVLAELRPAVSRSDDAEPEPFTPWVNFWHPDDFLSYPIRHTFGQLNDGLSKNLVIDHQAHHAGLFPGVHSDYLQDAASGVFQCLRYELTSRGLLP